MKSLFLKAVLHDPAGYSRKVARQFLLFANRPFGNERIILKTTGIQNAEAFDSPSFLAMSDSLRGDRQFDTVQAVPLHLGNILRNIPRNVNKVVLPTMLLALVLCVCGPVEASVRRLHLRLILIPIIGCVGIALTCSMVHSLEVNRYNDIAIANVALAFTGSAAICLLHGLTWLSRRRSAARKA